MKLDQQGTHLYGVEYRREHLTGKGSSDGDLVGCIGAEWLVKFHSGLPDVKALSLSDSEFRCRSNSEDSSHAPWGSREETHFSKSGEKWGRR